jgi:eukaryotic-like serine/threonine-protein kinase
MRQKVGHYEVVSELGRGGMGVVYKGFEPALSRHVAIKLMSEALAHDQQVVERFLREARSMAQLNDPHIIQIYMIGEDAGQPFFAMEFVEGESLSQTLRREGKIEPKRALGIIAQAAKGLSTAHDRGVVHRDIKPANLMLTPKGLVKVADFGIALATKDFSQKLTGTGEFVGTPGYLSPEVCLGQQVDQRSDVFSLGIVLFEMLAGRMPFTDQSPLGLMLEVVRAEIPDVRTLGANVNQDVINVLYKMLAKDPEHRYASCQDLLEDIERIVVMPSLSGGAVGNTSASTLPNAPRSQAQATHVRVAAPAPQVPGVPPAFAPNPAQQPLPAVAQAPYVQQVGYASMPPAGQKSKAPIAIAAALLIGGASAGAYVFKDSLFDNKGDRVAQAGPIGSAALTETNEPVQTANTDAPAASDAAPAAQQDAANPPVTATQDTATLSQANGSEQAAVAATDAAPAMPIAAVESAPSPSTSQPTLPKSGAQDVETPAIVESTDPQLRREPLAGLKSQSGALNKRDLGPQVASTTPTPKVSPPPAAVMTPRVIVLAMGDLGPAGAAEVEIENALMDSGYNVVDEDAFPSLSRLRGGGNVAAAIQAARAAGISAIVTVRAQRTGSQQISFYGQSDTLTLATLEVKAFDSASGSALNSFREELQYTGLNANEKGRDAVSTHLGQLASRLAKHRR